MPRYSFKLNDDDHAVEDDSGVSLLNAVIAYRYACKIVRELMNHREQATRDWQLHVYENDEKVFEILFADLDETLACLTSEQHELVKKVCWQRRSLKNVLQEAKVTCRETEALVARSRGKLYLAAEFGQRTIRDDTGARFQSSSPIKRPRAGGRT